MSIQEWQCPHCGDPLDDNCVRLEASQGETVFGYCLGCASEVAEAYATAQQARGDNVETARPGDTLVPDFNEFKALETRVERVEATWKLWLVEAERGSINPSTFAAMRALMGIEKA